MRAPSYYLKNCMIALESILSSMLNSGFPRWLEIVEENLQTLLAALLHPRRHFDYNISYIIKVIFLAIVF